MGKKLAIKGHSTYGKEIIEIFEMLGGRNSHERTGNNDKTIYYIDDRNNINCDWTLCNNDSYTILTFEEFLEKCPFKVGDKVIYTKFGYNYDDCPVTIESMKWTGTTIEYTFNDCVTCLAKDLKMWNGEPDVVISGIYLNSCDYADEVELNLGDYEIEVRDGRTYAVLKKHKYPTTYAECCDVLSIAPYYNLRYHTYEPNYDEYATTNALCSLQYKLNILGKLIICLDAYWTIAGEKMGLNEPWEPDWKNVKNVKYGITLHDDIITKMYLRNENVILAFPTEEMRDAFYENFKDLIEQCKELL